MRFRWMAGAPIRGGHLPSAEYGRYPFRDGKRSNIGEHDNPYALRLKDYLFRRDFFFGRLPFVSSCERTDAANRLASALENRRLELAGKDIVVKRDEVAPLCITPHWNEETLVCDLYIDDRAYYVWQVCQKILREFLFGPR